MNRRIRNVLSAMTAAALCAANVSAYSANSGFQIEPDSKGIDKGYTYEYTNNDKDSKTTMLIEAVGNIICNWDNDENMTASRGLKFASPVEYEKLGDITWKYWKRFDVEDFTNNKGYLRYGIRVRNTKGETFDIMEIDASANGKSIMEKDSGYKKIGTVDSCEIFNDYTIFGPTEGEKYDVPYTIYSYDGKDGPTVLCRRNEPLTVNNYNEDSRRIIISDKLDAIAALGYDIGEITDITNLFDVSYSKGEAHIYIDDVTIENMPEIAPDEYDEDAPLIIKNYDYGERDGYYYSSSNQFDGQTEIIKPSLFKAEWDSTENKNNVNPVFERGKTFEGGQSYKALSGSSVDYSMKFDAEGKFWAGSRSTLSSYSTDEYNYQIDLYIVDACKDWSVAKKAEAIYTDYEKIGEVEAGGNTYDVYNYETGITGSFKSIKMGEYYFVNRDAVKNGEIGEASVKYSLEPFVEFIHDRGEILGKPSSLVVMVDGGISKGSAELTRNVVTLPDFIKDDGEYDKAVRRIKITGSDDKKTIGDYTYGTSGYDVDMDGYADGKITCTWKKDPGTAEYPYDKKGKSSFSVSKGGFSSWSFPGSFDFTADGFVGMTTGGWNQSSYSSKEHLVIGYDVDLEELTDKDKESGFDLKGVITCSDNDYNATFAFNDIPSEITGYHAYTIVVRDKWSVGPPEEMNMTDFGPAKPVELGTIETNGVKYDAIVYYPGKNSYVAPCIMLTRKESLKSTKSGDAENYKNTIDADDVVNKLSLLGFNLGNITSTNFSMEAAGNSGKAVINSVSLESVTTEKEGFTEEDVVKLTYFLEGKRITIPEGTDYDLNKDGVWDVFDLCMLKKEVADKK